MTLAAARAELKLSVADVSQQIKYGVRQIAAIESDDYAKLPGMTFVRGMIRSYAKLVQIDPEPLLANLGRRDIPSAVSVDLRTDGQEPFVESGGKSNRIYVLLSVAALVAVAVVAYEWRINPLDTGEVVTIKSKSSQGDASPAARAKTPALDASATPAQTPAPALLAANPPAPATAQAQVPVQAKAKAPAHPAPTVPASEADLAAPAAKAAEPRERTEAPAAQAAGGVSGLRRIDLAFGQLSWVEIKQADGKVLLSQLNPAGTSQVIRGVPPFDVVIGNAASVRLKYNNAAVDLRPYFKVDVARLRLE
ncbi:MAG: helix-turn-helix domain-containing protein [Burkholderiales bacterium]